MLLAGCVALVSGLLPLARELRRDPAGPLGKGTRGGTGTRFAGRLATAPAALVVRSASGDAAAIAPSVRDAVLAVEPAQPLGHVVAPDTFLADSLGAAPGAVWRLVVGQAMRAVALGVLVGAALAVAAGLTLVKALPSMEHARSSSVVPAVLVLVFTAFAAAAIPARRAALVNPIAALRQE